MTPHHGPNFPACEESTRLSTDNLVCSVFDRSKDDDKPALSIDDKAFLSIMNARPLLSVSTDPDMPAVLNPMLLTQKTSTVSAPSGNFGTAQLYRKQWKQVQCLSVTMC